MLSVTDKQDSLNEHTQEISELNKNYIFKGCGKMSINLLGNWLIVLSRDVKRSSNFRTSILKFEVKFDLHTFGIRSSD